MKHFLYFAIAILLIGCKTQPSYHNDPIPTHDSFSLTSKYVNEDRVINVWIPKSYKESNKKLPVLYMPDGGIKEDFPHIANTLDSLIQQNKIPEIILVGIENTQRGRDLTGESTVKEHEEYKIPMTDGAKNFRAFIKNELIPEINKRYKTTDKKGIIGESLAGLFVMETFFKQPVLFDFYIAMDPSLWWNNNYLVNNAHPLLKNLPNRDTKLWFAGSNTQDIQQYTQEFAAFLENHPPENLTWKYSDEPNEKHNTIYRATKEKALIWSLSDIK